MTAIRLALIAARAANGVIGRDNDLPWRIPEDMRYFMTVTEGKPVIMGRLTCLSIGRPLPRRTNIVVTSDRRFAEPGFTAVAGLADALDEARAAAHASGATEIFVIGGARLYAEALPLADRLYLTEIHQDFDGDVFFPAFDRRLWAETARRDVSDSTAVAGGYSFVVLDRIAESAKAV